MLRVTLGHAVVAFGIVLSVGGLGGFAQALLTASVVPDGDLLLRMGAAAVGASAGLALPIGALAGIAGGLRRLADDGAWLGLRCAGLGGRALVAPVGVLLAAAAGVWLGVTHVGEPAARAAMREARVTAAVRVRPEEGRALRVGGWTVAVEDGVLHFAGGDIVGLAHAWALSPAETGVIVHLDDGTLRTPTSTVQFGAIDAPLSLGDDRKVHPSERSSPDLARQVAVSAALGRDAYERWILWKRTLLPFCLVPIGLAAVPLALGRRSAVAVIVGAQVFSLWGLVRLADQGIGALGPVGAAAIVGGAALVWPVATWSRWADR